MNYKNPPFGIASQKSKLTSTLSRGGFPVFPNGQPLGSSLGKIPGGMAGYKITIDKNWLGGEWEKGTTDNFLWEQWITFGFDIQTFKEYVVSESEASTRDESPCQRSRAKAQAFWNYIVTSYLIVRFINLDTLVLIASWYYTHSVSTI